MIRFVLLALASLGAIEANDSPRVLRQERELRMGMMGSKGMMGSMSSKGKGKTEAPSMAPNPVDTFDELFAAILANDCVIIPFAGSAACLAAGGTTMVYRTRNLPGNVDDVFYCCNGGTISSDLAEYTAAGECLVVAAGAFCGAAGFSDGGNGLQVFPGGFDNGMSACCLDTANP